MSSVSSSSQDNLMFFAEPTEETENVKLTMDLLYDDAIYLIFEQLPLEDLAWSAEVCTRWYQLHSHNYLWRPYLTRDFGPAPCIDSVCRDVYLRCMSEDLWTEKQMLSETHEKVKLFVRNGFLIIYQTGTERVKKRDLYSDADVVRIPHEQSACQMDIIRGRLLTAGGSNALSVQSAGTLQDEMAVGGHKAWIKGFDRTEDRIVFYSTNGMITLIDPVGFQKEQEIQLPSKDIEKVLCFGQHLVISYTSTHKLTIFDLIDGEQKDFEISEEDSIATMARYQGQILIARVNGEVQLWDDRYQELKNSLQTSQIISTLDITKNSLVIGGIEGLVSVWRLPDFQTQGSFNASGCMIVQVKRTGDEITVLDKEGRLSTFQLGRVIN